MVRFAREAWRRRWVVAISLLGVLSACVGGTECDVLSQVSVYSSAVSGLWEIEADDGASTVRCELADLDVPRPLRCTSEDGLLVVGSFRWTGGAVLRVTSYSLPHAIHVRISRDGVELAERTVVMHHEASRVDLCPSSAEAIDLD